MKIYTDDPRVKYVNTTISPERTKAEIDEKLRAYGTYDIYWHWRPDLNDVYVQFIIEEVIDGHPAKVGAKVVMPTLWDKGNRNAHTPERRIEKVNVAASMRTMFWYIKSQLENSYAMQSSRVAAFLPDIITPRGSRIFDEMKGNLDQFKALEDHHDATQREVEVITPNKPRNVTYESS
jgi:hypothetical protein